MSQKEELRERIEAKRKELEARLHETRADTSAESRDTRQKLEAKLAELNDTLKDGWDKVSESVAAKLNTWLRS